MNRLTIFIPLMISSLFTVAPSRAVFAQDVRYTIAGDVAQPDTYQFPSRQPVHLLELLRSSGTQFIEGNAVILRDSPPRPVGSEFVRAGQSDQGSLLAAGDIVILQRTDTLIDGGNVVLLTDDLPMIVKFDGRAGSVAKLLESVQTFLPANVQVPTIRTERGRPATVHLSASEPLLHGDVLLLSSVIPVSGLRISEIFSVQQASWEQAPSPMASVPFEEMPRQPDAFGQPDEPHAPFLSATPVASQSAATAKTAAFLAGSGSANMATRSSAGGLMIPGLPNSDPRTARLSQTSHVSALSGGPVVRPAMSDGDRISTVGMSSAIEHTQSAEAAVLAAALADSAVPAAGADHSLFWNIVFVAGLLISMGLVIAGWLKTRADQEMQSEMNSMLRTSVDSSQTQDVDEADSDFTLETSPLQQYAATAGQEKKQSVIENVLADLPPQTLIDRNEWLGGEWISTATPSEPMPSQVLANDSNASEVDVLVSHPVAESSGMAAQSSAERSSLFAEEKSVAGDSGRAATTEWNPTEPPNELQSSLEAMIQNRLPINLKSADLPLQVTLFGRPAGPRRLRIDAAHDGVPAPHMARRSRSVQRVPEPVAATAAAPSSSEQRPAVGPTQSSDSANSSPSASELDRALNSLQEPSDS